MNNSVVQHASAAVEGTRDWKVLAERRDGSQGMLASAQLSTSLLPSGSNVWWQSLVGSRGEQGLFRDPPLLGACPSPCSAARAMGPEFCHSE